MAVCLVVESSQESSFDKFVVRFWLFDKHCDVPLFVDSVIVRIHANGLDGRGSEQILGMISYTLDSCIFESVESVIVRA